VYNLYAAKLTGYFSPLQDGDILTAASDTESGSFKFETSGYATWFTAGGAIRIAHYDVIDDVITRKL